MKTEIPYEINQTWRIGKYNAQTRKCTFIPVVSVRMTPTGPSKRVKRSEWLRFIEVGWLSVSEDMKRWLTANGYEKYIPELDGEQK